MQYNTSRQEHIKQLYLEVFPAAARYIGKTGGSFEEAKDIFQDVLLAYFEKRQNSRLCDPVGQGFVPETTEKAYLLGMARNLWHKKLERYNRHFVRTVPEVKDQDEEQISGPRLLNFLERTGKKCMELLQAVYYEKMPMPNIAQQFGFSGERSATVQKHKCLEKVRDAVKEKSLVYEDFYE